MGVRGGAPANSEITHPRPEVPPRRAVKSPPASLSEPAKPDQAEPPPKRDNPQPGDSTPSLSTNASMGMASHPEASKSVGQDAQPEPADAGGAKRASPKALRVEKMMGTAMGRREIPLHPLPMSYRAATILWMGAGAVDPIHLTMTTIRLIHESGPDSEYYAPRLLYPDKVNLVEDALALPLWQGLSEDQFFQMLDNASANDRRFGEYDWDFLSKAILSDTMNADDIHHAGAKALADWAEENLGPLSIGPRPELVARLQQMQTEKGFPDRESANESGVGSGRQYVPRPPLEDQPNSNQISADVFRGREVRLGLTLPDSQSGDDELSAQDATWNVAYCDFYKAAANLWRARSCLREAAGCMIETGYIHPQMAAAIAATEKVERFCNVLRAANRYAGLGTYRFNDIVARGI